MKTKLLTFPLALAMAASVVLTTDTSAADSSADSCPLYEEVSNTQLLRRLSLDLRLTSPSYTEYDDLGTEPVPESVIDDYLVSDEFKDMVRRYHMDLLWSNVNNVDLSSNGGTLVRSQAIVPGEEVWFLQGADRKGRYRGDRDAVCANYEQENYNDDGTPTVNDDGLDGWKWVTPYWDPSTPVRVCAFDAQEVSGWSRGEPGVAPGGPSELEKDRCDLIFTAENKQGCGCGPNLEFCWTADVEATVTTALREQLMLLAEEVTVGELSYSELLTTKRTYINGPLAVFKRHLAKMTKFSKTFNMWQEGDADPPETIRYVDAEFQEYERGDLHSGVLTMAGFTLRFQTNRGRANRARTVFMGKYFEPPAAAESGCDPTHPDPMQQCYCQHCHTTLEPMAAYWGKISEAGSALLPISDFPHELPCANPNDPTEAALCAQFYVNDVEQEGFGMRLPLQWADGPTDDHQRLRSNFDAGPSALAATITDTDNGPFFETTVKTLWRYFMRRDMNLNPLDPDNEIALLDELTQTLRETDDFRTLVREIVLLDQYRRMR